MKSILLFTTLLFSAISFSAPLRKPAALKKLQVVICGEGTEKDASAAFHKALASLNKKFFEGSPDMVVDFFGGPSDGGISAESLSAPSVTVVPVTGGFLAAACVTVAGQGRIAGP